MPRPQRVRLPPDERGAELLEAARRGVAALEAGKPARLLSQDARASVVVLLTCARLTLKRAGMQLAEEYRTAEPELGAPELAWDEADRLLHELRELYQATERLTAEVRLPPQLAARPSLFD